MKPHAGNEFAAFIGIDWADAEHELAGPTPLGESPASWRLHGRLDATRSAPHSARRRFEHPVPNDPLADGFQGPCGAPARPLSLLTVWRAIVKAGVWRADQAAIR
jgi:hypothetical protein